MRFAYVDGKKIEAKPKLRGKCPVCGEEVIAKCGKTKVNHWAHKAKTLCDRWWEPETDWHRMWKDYFPQEWQEVVMHDEVTGEKHIADVHTPYGISLEFQHSFIKDEERISRESFHKNLMWVVDGTRLPSDVEKFRNASSNNFVRIGNSNFAYTTAPERCFPKNWLTSEAPVFFDFVANNENHNLFCLMPGRSKGKAAVLVISKKAFVELLYKGNIFDESPKEYIKVLQQELEKIEKLNIQRLSFNRPVRRSRRL